MTQVRAVPVHPGYMPALDGLRGLAVAAVLAFHTGHFSGGFLGVDLFFVLSGFLITALLVAERQATGAIDLRRFWARRARRLLPALLVVLAAVVAYAAWLAGPSELEGIRTDVLATLGYVANWEHVVGAGPELSALAVLSPLEHTWSLAIEEQFYLVWPLVAVAVLIVASGSARWLLAVTLALAGASAVAMAVLHRPGTGSARAYFGTDTRALSILAGAALALVLARREGGPPADSEARFADSATKGGARTPPLVAKCWGEAGGETTTPGRERVALEVGGLAGAGGLAVAWTVVGATDDGLYGGGFAALAIASVAVIAAAAHPDRGPLGRALSFSPLRALGLISYGLYLWHWPVYVVTSASRTGLDGWTLNGLRVGISLGLAVASYFAVERPIRAGALGGKAAWTVSLGCTVAVVAGTFWATQGARQP